MFEAYCCNCKKRTKHTWEPDAFTTDESRCSECKLTRPEQRQGCEICIHNQATNNENEKVNHTQRGLTNA